MLHPSLQDLTTDKVNRYKLVIATAKCARYVTDHEVHEREIAEQRKDLERLRDKNDPAVDLNNEKAVSVAIKRIHDGAYKIVE